MSQHLEAQIAVLETLLSHYETLLEKDLEEREELKTTNKILREISKIKLRLQDLKRLAEEK
jgi:hypothetical protein